MANPFDKFDAPSGNPFDKFDAAPGDNDRAQARAFIADGNNRRKAEGFAAGQQAGNDIAMFLPNLAAGGVRGAGSIGSTALAPLDMARDAMAGKGLSLESNRERRAGIDGGLQALGADPSSIGYKGGKLGIEFAGTAGAGGVLSKGATALGASPAFATALSTSGMRAGQGGGAANLGMRVAGGAITGGAMAGMVNPEDAKIGASIGGMLPLAMLGAGKAGNLVGGMLSGGPQSAEKIAAIKAARDVGYVIPPTQAKPSLVNRALEGFSGKLTTAQNASARNQTVTNELARKAIGAAELTPGGLYQVRQKANQAYEKLGQAGAFQADDAFVTALDRAGATTDAMRRNFPALVNNEVDTLISSLKANPQFDAAPTVQAIKQFRADASVNKAAMDPGKKALGKAQGNIAGALEDLIDRNLTQAGQADLLTEYRVARQILAKTHDVEKAMNPASGNINAAKFAQMADKGRPLTGELKTIANFAGTFPKAVQSVDKMGSLPGVSPLDFGAMATMSSVTANPALMAGVLARPAARSLTLSGAVQNRLLPSNPGYLERLLEDERTRQLMYRSAPLLGRD